ncbi:MAG: DUF6529 family protein [Actinomycetota bacterium]
MDDLVEQITRGNVSGVKIVLATVVAVLSTYQVALMAVGYGKVKLPFLTPKPASFAHRALGDMILVITLFVAWMCVTYFEISDGIEHAVDGETGRATVHVIAGSALVLLLTLKVVVVRWWHAAGRFLPAIGLSIFGAFVVTWFTSAGDYLLGA